jgi:hypothetical protein
LLEIVKSSNRLLFATGVLDVEYVIDGNVTPPTMTPEPEEYIDNLLIATYAAYVLISGDLSRKVRSGELGIRFKSGQDEISTGEASRHMSSIAKDIMKEYRGLVISKLSDRDDGFVRAQ